jgi:hypothetical protein
MMNAYELADLMLDVTDCESSEYHQAGLMLRQQADRIAELSKNVDELEEELLKAPQIKELSDEEIEKVRVAIMETAYWCAENGDSESYNAVKVMCSKVLAMLRGEK